MVSILFGPKCNNFWNEDQYIQYICQGNDDFLTGDRQDEDK